MSDKILVIVESPTKAKTIKKFLPSNFIVKASIGHVRDLPQSASAIPAKYKGEEWAKLGVNVDQDFEPIYVVPKGKSKIITELRKDLKNCSQLYLATDEDREGESISWHLLELLKPKVPVKRMVFHEITKSAIEKALENTRDIDYQLVASQETRRILDRLVGYSLSPLIWKKIAYGLSAGRVQSAGVRMLVERERERIKFVKAEYWDLKAQLAKDGKEFEAKLVQVGDKRVASGKDFEPYTGKLKKPDDVIQVDEKQAGALLKELKQGPWNITKVEEKDVKSKPYPPFITSTLQQEASRKLGFTSRTTMRTAQALYEQGLITYMRTDSPTLSSQALAATRKQVEKLYGKEYLSPQPRQFSAKSKAAQEAHEAIRPAGAEFTEPGKTGLSDREFKLYDLIWKRTMASQMAEAKKKSMQVRIASKDALFAASGMKIVFPGFLRVYVEGKDSPDEALEDREVLLPDLKVKDTVDCNQLEKVPHETKPIARYTEASLIQALEKSGIGRPSTYASIISTIMDRDYAHKQGTALVPSYTGFVVIQLLEKHFEYFIDYNFTSTMEEALDEIAEGTREAKPYLKEFFLGKNGLRSQIEKKEPNIDPDDSREVKLLKKLDEDVELRVGRFGPFLIKKTPKGEEDIRASIPNDIAPSELTKEKIDEIIEISEKGPQPIGKHPDTGENIYALLGRYGPYVQLGEVTDDNPKPKRASIPKELNVTSITLDEAVHLLILPRTLGADPETGEEIRANRGRFGPYVQKGDDFRSIKEPDDVYTIDLKRALAMLAEPKVSRRGSKKLKELGEHPSKKKKIELMEGKYGPFLKMGTKNFGLEKDVDIKKLDLAQAVKIIKAKEDQS